jgi:hypothetical protein
MSGIVCVLLVDQRFLVRRSLPIQLVLALYSTPSNDHI